MSNADFFAKLVVNIVLWIITLMVIAFLIPSLFSVFGDGKALPRDISVSDFGDRRIVIAQIIAAIVGTGVSLGITKLFPPPPAPNAPNPMATAALLFREESFSILVNFGTLNIVFAIVSRQSNSLIATVILFTLAFVLK